MGEIHTPSEHCLKFGFMCDKALGNAMGKSTGLTSSSTTSDDGKDVVFAKNTSDFEGSCDTFPVSRVGEELVQWEIVDEDCSCGDGGIALWSRQTEFLLRCRRGRRLGRDDPYTSRAGLPLSKSIGPAIQIEDDGLPLSACKKSFLLVTLKHGQDVIQLGVEFHTTSDACYLLELLEFVEELCHRPVARCRELRLEFKGHFCLVLPDGLDRRNAGASKVWERKKMVGFEEGL